MSCFVLLRPTSAGIKTARMPSASNFNGALTSGRMTPDRICSDWLRLAFASLQIVLISRILVETERMKNKSTINETSRVTNKGC
ncbi:hypothetical protein OUZ56_001512 [Daphnia magna]|uniref:Uncharacterized protein n=1 Tax=Daphnia magna TaxID=35525 RepID=A0ABR0A2Y0_9CRUS|nr:hypothetical protein OUZ56_001512 [Daphnia magna]